jgi:hypothetical protein
VRLCHNFPFSYVLPDSHFSIRTDKERLTKLQHVVAKLLGIDVTETDKSDVIQVCIEIGEAYLEAVEKMQPKFWKTFTICFASKKGLLENYNWKQSKQEATRQQLEELMREMQEKFKINAEKVLVVQTSEEATIPQ